MGFMKNAASTMRSLEGRISHRRSIVDQSSLGVPTLKRRGSFTGYLAVNTTCFGVAAMKSWKLEEVRVQRRELAAIANEALVVACAEIGVAPGPHLPVKEAT
eukprot:7386362-Prymnesium_polylepis.1